MYFVHILQITLNADSNAPPVLKKGINTDANMLGTKEIIIKKNLAKASN